MEKAYLSIDIDFWEPDEWSIAATALHATIAHAAQTGIPLHAVMNHQHMLPRVNDCGASVLINYDAHTDVFGRDIDILHCGSWISYVTWRNTGTYIWVHASNSYLVDDAAHALDVSKRQRPYWANDVDWKSVCELTADQQRVDLIASPLASQYEVVGVGISLSPAYSSKRLENITRKLIKQYGIPYKYGRRAEDNCVRCKPPRSMSCGQV